MNRSKKKKRGNMVTMAEELKYLRLIKESSYAVEDEDGESQDIEISEMDLSPPEQFTKYESVISRDYQTGTAAYYVLENSFSCNVVMETLAFLLEAVLGKREGNIIYGTNSSILQSYTILGGYGTYEKKILGAILDSLTLEVESEFITASAETKAKIDSKEPLKDLSEFEFDKIPLSFYHVDSVQMRREGETDWMEMRCKTNKITFEIKNNVNTDDARGMGSRYMCKTPRCAKREIGLTLTVDDTDEKYLEMYWGSDEGPRRYLAGEYFELKFYIRNGDQKFELYFPKNIISQPSATANADPIKYELSIVSLSKTVDAEDMTNYAGKAGAIFARIADSDPNPEYNVELNFVDSEGTPISEALTISLMDGEDTIDADTLTEGSVTLQAEDGKYTIEVTTESTINKLEPETILVDGASKTKTIVLDLQ